MKHYNEQDEPRIRELTKYISVILNTTLAEFLRELFEDIYGDTCNEEYRMILSKLVLIEQETLPVAEMKYKRVGEVRE